MLRTINNNKLKKAQLLNDLSYNKEKINRALSESIAWLTSLNLLRDESYSLKTTLSKVLDDNTTGKELITEAENFHNLIIEIDEYIREISVDVKNQEKKLRELLNNPDNDKSWLKEQHKLRNEIIYLERDLQKMREDFYRKLLKRTS